MTAASIAKELREGLAAKYSSEKYYSPLYFAARSAPGELATLIEAFEAMGEALKPFASIAEMESKSPDGASVFVNVSRCRDAAAALAKAGL